MILPVVKDLHAWLEYINLLHPKTVDLGLDRVRTVADRLGLFPFEPFSVIVAGTNGKGSTVGFLEYALTAGGYRTGAMTSPHLHRFNERIRLDGKEVEDKYICEAFSAIESARNEISLSYFEFATLAGLLILKNARCGIALLEVGLGGRLDAVNVVDADVAVITNIDFDHQDYLGNTREEIGFEKAGILRQGIPLIFGAMDLPDSIQVLAKQLKVKLHQRGRDYDIGESSHYSGGRIPDENIANAIQTLNIIQHLFPVSPEIIADTIKNFSLEGRWQIVETPLMHIYDVAHNPHGMRLLKKFLEQQCCTGKTHAIFSMLRTKDLATCLTIMDSSVDTWFVAPVKTELSWKTEEFRDAFSRQQITDARFCQSIAEACRQAKKMANPSDRLVIFGSFYTVAEAQSIQV